jgi:predicted GNAT family N-acyltransferase
MDEIRIVDGDWESLRALATPLRTEVFVHEQGVPQELEWDEQDAVSHHFIARDGTGTVIGTARLLPDGHIGRMAVHAAHRRRGVGRRLMQAVLARATELGHRQVVLAAQLQAVAFYESLGFQAYGELFYDAGLPHRWMSRGV